MIEMKPCPFCGRDVQALVIKPNTNEYATWMPDYPRCAFIKCNCGAAMLGKSVADVSESWNRREGSNARALCAYAEKTDDGKCVGYQRSEWDDEPPDMCKECRMNQFFEEDENNGI